VLDYETATEGILKVVEQVEAFLDQEDEVS